MKRMIFMLVVIGFTFTAAYSQIASTECIDELKTVYGQIDHAALMGKSDSVATRIDYYHRYISKTDPKQDTVKGNEWRIYSTNFMHHDSPDIEEVIDATDNFHHRKYQYVIYRSKAKKNDAAFIPGVDIGVLNFAMVRECMFIPADPNMKNMAYKWARLTVSKEGQKTYPVEEMTFKWNPVSGELLKIEVSFNSNSLTRWAEFTFERIDSHYSKAGLPADAQSLIMSGGSLADDYKGAKLMDYR